MRKSFFFCLTTFCVFIAITACNPKQKPAEHKQVLLNSTDTFTEDDAAELDMNEIYSAVRKKGELMLIYGTQVKDVTHSYKNIAEEIKKNFKRINIIVKSDNDVTKEELSSFPLFLLGSPHSNKIIKNFADSTPFQHTNQGFKFNESTYQQPNDHYILGIYPSPFNSKLPISIISGNQDIALIQSLKKLFEGNWRRLLWNSWGYQVFRDGKRTILGQFSRKRETLWEIDPQLHWDLASETQTKNTTKHFKLIAHGNFESESLISLLPSCENTLSQIEDFTGKKADFIINYHVYSTLETKGLATNNTQQAHNDFRKMETHTTINEEFANNFIQKENEIILRNLIGKPKKTVLEEGLAIHFTTSWQREGYGYWAKKLYESGNLIPIHELVNNDLYEQESRLVFGAMAGVFVDFLLDTWGKEKF